MPEVRSPTVRRRELGAILRALRTQKGFTVEQAAAQLMFSMSKLSRMETGHGIATARDIRDLCDLYDVTDPAERDRLMTLAREGRRQAWWQSYDLSYETYAGLEAEAVVISAFQSSAVHGLLHTADYARAGHEVAMPRLPLEQIEMQIEAKLTRQRILTKDNPPRFAVVLDEAALHRVVGGRQVMAAQLAKILEVSARPNVVVQVLPYERGAHPAMESNFTILELPDQTPDIVFVEGMIGSTYLDRDDDLKRYREVFHKLQSIALNPKDTADLIVKRMRDYGDGSKAALFGRTVTNSSIPNGYARNCESRQHISFCRSKDLISLNNLALNNLDVGGLQWRKARRSVNNGACIEVAPVSGQILIRDSMDRNGLVMRYSERSWCMFVADAKTGRFDPDRL